MDVADATRRGFTGHEHLDNISLVHMNGRVYDPRLGRFLSADPYVDGVVSTQGWNRYSYVHNGLLNAIDPSGFFCWSADGCDKGALFTGAPRAYIYGSRIPEREPNRIKDWVAALPEPGVYSGEAIFSTVDGSGAGRRKCTIADDLANLRNAIRRFIYNDAWIPYISINATGIAGAGNTAAFRQWGYGLNLVGQVFAQESVPLNGPGSLQADALIIAGEVGINIGFSRGIQRDGVSKAHLTQGFAYLRSGSSFGIEGSSSGGNVSVPDMAVPRALRVGTGLGLGTALVDGDIKTFSNASSPSLVDAPGNFIPCN